MGFGEFMASVDCMVMGRGCMEKLASFNLAPEQWPYGDIPILALSRTLTAVPENLQPMVELHPGDVPALVAELEGRGLKHAYVDGGATITAFLNEKLISRMTITQAPVLLGSGKRLFGETSEHIRLENARATAYPNDFIQVQYQVSYS